VFLSCETVRVVDVYDVSEESTANTARMDPVVYHQVDCGCSRDKVENVRRRQFSWHCSQTLSTAHDVSHIWDCLTVRRSDGRARQMYCVESSDLISHPSLVIAHTFNTVVVYFEWNIS
jgi:hypothetical protein